MSQELNTQHSDAVPGSAPYSFQNLFASSNSSNPHERFLFAKERVDKHQAHDSTACELIVTSCEPLDRKIFELEAGGHATDAMIRITRPTLTLRNKVQEYQGELEESKVTWAAYMAESESLRLDLPKSEPEYSATAPRKVATDFLERFEKVIPQIITVFNKGEMYLDTFQKELEKMTAEICKRSEASVGELDATEFATLLALALQGSETTQNYAKGLLDKARTGEVWVEADEMIGLFVEADKTPGPLHDECHRILQLIASEITTETDGPDQNELVRLLQIATEAQEAVQSVLHQRKKALESEQSAGTTTVAP